MLILIPSFAICPYKDLLRTAKSQFTFISLRVILIKQSFFFFPEENGVQKDIKLLIVPTQRKFELNRQVY